MESDLFMSVLSDWVGDSILGFLAHGSYLVFLNTLFSMKHKDKANVKLQATGKVITKKPAIKRGAQMSCDNPSV